MTLPHFLNVLSACIGLVAALFLCLGTARLSNQAIWLLSTTFWDFNPHVAKALSAQRAEYVAGAALLVLTFVIQLAANVYAASAEQYFRTINHAFMVAAVTTALAALLGLALRSRVAAAARRFVSEHEAKLK